MNLITLPVLPSREELVRQLVTLLAHPNGCISLSAPNNFGKSVFLRNLVVPLSKAGLWPVYINCNLRAADTDQAFNELILRRLIPVASPAGRERLAGYYQALVQAESGSLAASLNFLLAMEAVLEAGESRKLVLLLDEFDAPQNFLSTRSLFQLRALHDHFPGKLTYLTATRFPLLAMARATEEESAEFYELFTTCAHLPPLAPAEAGLSRDDDLLYRLSGGHPGLLRLLRQSSKKWQPGETEAVYLDWLKSDLQIRLECQRLWQSVHSSEQTALLQFLEGVRSGPEASSLLGTLTQRGLVTGERIFALAFEWFLREKLNETEAASPGLESEAQSVTTLNEIAYDPRTKIVVFSDGRKLPLSGNAATLFHYLFVRQSVPFCTKDELISAIWGPHMAYSSENLDRLVSDLRHMLGDQDKQIIRTIHRRGLQMVGVRQI